MSTGYSLVLFIRAEDSEGKYHYNAHVFKLDSAQAAKLVCHRFIEIKPPPLERSGTAYGSSDAVFNPQVPEIVLTSFDDENWMRLFHIGKHLWLSSYERPLFKPAAWRWHMPVPSIQLQSNTITIGATVKDEAFFPFASWGLSPGYKGTWEISPRYKGHVARQDTTGNWTKRKINTNASGADEAQVGMFARFSRSLNESMRYVHFIQTRQKYTDKLLELYSTDNKSFAATTASTNASIIWQRYVLQAEFQWNDHFCTFTTSSKDGEAHKLYLFTANGDMNRDHITVSFAYVPLRGDGSVDVDEGEFHCLGQGFFLTPAVRRFVHLDVFQWPGERKMVVILNFISHPDKFTSYVADIGEDGSLPQTSEGWKELPLEVTLEIPDPTLGWAEKFDSCATVVPNSFLD